MKPASNEEAKGGEMVADLPNTANVALLLLLLSTFPELLLSHGHLLFHVADLLFCPSTVLLEEQHKRMRKEDRKTLTDVF